MRAHHFPTRARTSPSLAVGTCYTLAMDERVKKIEEQLTIIRERNIRVESDKAWETSAFRKISIAAITYVIASAVLYVIGVSNFYLSAIIPTLGYLLSTLSLPVIKKWWIRTHFHR